MFIYLKITDQFLYYQLYPSFFERVVYQQLYEYFDKNDYFYRSQYGFRKSHSTEHAILEIVDKITHALDNRNNPLAIFLDLSKAFDTLNHHILLKKLDYYGVKDLSHRWFYSYLSNREQYVLFKSSKFIHLPIQTGVPQGSILGPLLYLIYMNDIQNSSSFFDFILYADDTTLYSSDTNKKIRYHMK